MKVQRCKGFRDVLPDEMARFRHIEAVFRNCCQRWGYQEIRTPTLEYLHLFTATGTLTSTTLSKTYSFLDWDGWSGERVVMRPDGTIPVARLYIDSAEAKGLAKYFYVTNLFLFEETGKQNREKWQGGVELIGVDSVLADVELISMALETLQDAKAGLVELRLSHAGLIRVLLAALGISYDEQMQLFDRILEGDFTTLTEKAKAGSTAGKVLSGLLNLKGKSSSVLKNLKSIFSHELPDLALVLENLIDILDMLSGLGIACNIDIGAGRGFEYYTGIVFRLLIDGVDVGGGGRYNALVPLLSGKETPASGFALYFDRLMDTVKAVDTTVASVLIKTVSTSESVQTGLELARRVHQTGGIAEMDLGQGTQDGFLWTIEVHTAHAFTLINLNSRKKHIARNIDQVLKILKNERKLKNSTAKRASAR